MQFNNLGKQWEEVRNTRNRLINDISWRIQRYDSEIRRGVEPTDRIDLLDDYIQRLRDVTKQTDPFSISWPNVITATTSYSWSMNDGSTQNPSNTAM